MSSGFTLTGMDTLISKLAVLATRAPQAVGAAIYAEAQIERTESMRRTPVDTGALRASHRLRGPDVIAGGRDVSVAIEVGGVAAPYAIQVHENVDAFHRVGQAKFLESTILESRPYMLQRLARRLDIEKVI